MEKVQRRRRVSTDGPHARVAVVTVACTSRSPASLRLQRQAVDARARSSRIAARGNCRQSAWPGRDLRRPGALAVMSGVCRPRAGVGAGGRTPRSTGHVHEQGDLAARGAGSWSVSYPRGSRGKSLSLIGSAARAVRQQAVQPGKEASAAQESRRVALWHPYRLRLTAGRAQPALLHPARRSAPHFLPLSPSTNADSVRRVLHRRGTYQTPSSTTPRDRKKGSQSCGQCLSTAPIRPNRTPPTGLRRPGGRTSGDARAASPSWRCARRR